ncbi:hypothetical protein JMJ55_23710 [Belnapia sp. T6]|uniref:Uncharacterized protein n=1 Tax=Belnapia mucosa TaxID=2804532 RepID=A0ABS1V9J5_9PROT|nr:hypothetical protein [Belnapia mucosa]MBL6458349.1 hypothetical protein [Belnapia mucosa]
MAVLAVILAAQHGALEPLRPWLLGHHEALGLSEPQVEHWLHPASYSAGSLLAATNGLPAPWDVLAKLGLLVFALVFLLAALRAVLRAGRWLREMVI